MMKYFELVSKITLWTMDKKSESEGKLNVDVTESDSRLEDVQYDFPPSYDQVMDQPSNISRKIGWCVDVDSAECPSFQTSATPCMDRIEALSPTLLPAVPFDPDEDCQMLKSFSKGIFGTDEKAVIGVMGKRTWKQRLDVCEAYQNRYGKSFTKKLSSSLARVLIMRPQLYLAYDLYEAIHHTETRSSSNSDGSTYSETVHSPLHRNIIEIICSRSPEELKDLKIRYENELKSKNDLIKEIKKYTSGKLSMLLNMLLTETRDFVGINEQKVQVDVQRLNQCDECMIDRGSYYADALRQAMTKRDMDTILRIVATTCETDLGRIKNLYNQRYQKTLEEGIHKHASGTTKHILLAFCGNPRS
ncbi:annexin B9-like isoform X4 [Artemia franciscana]|uniref:annexin B9-like isoform X4 n=1 Tax=Artemia franciscana TaxID=6661 RepID=UPI0032DB2871